MPVSLCETELRRNKLTIGPIGLTQMSQLKEFMVENLFPLIDEDTAETGKREGPRGHGTIRPRNKQHAVRKLEPALAYRYQK